MDTEKLVATGLTEQQALAYALLIEEGRITPSNAAEKLNLSRTNSYKLFDKLVSMKLATKQEVAKKFVYSAANPQFLTNLVAEQRNIAVSREVAVQAVLGDLLAKYHTYNDQPFVSTVTGRIKVADAYRTQIQQKQPIYFVRSHMDIPVMGFDVMHEIRTIPARHDGRRYGIAPDIATGTTNNPEADKRSNLDRTWMKDEDYTAPVEWSVSGTSLLIVLFDTEPHAITIDHPAIADAFRQIWHLLNTCLKAMPYYKDLPR